MPLVCTVTSLVYHPLLPDVPPVIVRAAEGALASRLMLTESLLVPPVLVAEQERAVPDVSLDIVVSTQPTIVKED